MWCRPLILTEADGSQVQGQPEIHVEVQGSQRYCLPVIIVIIIMPTDLNILV